MTTTTIHTDTQTQARTVDLMAIARKALAEAGGDANAAARIIVQLADDDQDVCDKLVASGAASAVSLALSARRVDIVRTVANPDRATRPGDRGLELMERTSLKGLLAWPVPWIQKPLGECFPHELDEPMNRCSAERDTHSANFNFLNLVKREAKDPKKRLKAQLTPEELNALRKRAEKAVS